MTLGCAIHLDGVGFGGAVIALVPILLAAARFLHSQVIVGRRAINLRIVVHDLHIVHTVGGCGPGDLLAVAQWWLRLAGVVQGQDRLGIQAGVIGHDQVRGATPDEELHPVLIPGPAEEVGLPGAIGGDVACQGAGIVGLVDIAGAVGPSGDGELVPRVGSVLLVVVLDLDVVGAALGRLPHDPRPGAEAGRSAALIIQPEDDLRIGPYVGGLDGVGHPRRGLELHPVHVSHRTEVVRLVRAVAGDLHCVGA